MRARCGGGGRPVGGGWQWELRARVVDGHPSTSTSRLCHISKQASQPASVCLPAPCLSVCLLAPFNMACMSCVPSTRRWAPVKFATDSMYISLSVCAVSPIVRPILSFLYKCRGLRVPRDCWKVRRSSILTFSGKSCSAFFIQRRAVAPLKYVTVHQQRGARARTTGACTRDSALLLSICTREEASSAMFFSPRVIARVAAAAAVPRRLVFMRSFGLGIFRARVVVRWHSVHNRVIAWARARELSTGRCAHHQYIPNVGQAQE